MNSDSLTAGSSLPGANDPAPTVPNPQTTAHRAKRDAGTVLIADDDRDLVNILSVRCRRIGLKVLAAHDAVHGPGTHPLAIAGRHLPRRRDAGRKRPQRLRDARQRRGLPRDPGHHPHGPHGPGHDHPLSLAVHIYVEKCTDIWNRLEPAAERALFTAEPTVPQIAPSVPAATAPSIPSAEAESKPNQIAPVSEPAPAPHREAVAAVPSEPQKPAAQTVSPALQTPAPAPPAAVAIDETPAAPEASAELTEETDPADLAFGEETSEATESVWKQLTQVVGRVVSRTVSQPEENPVSDSAPPPKRAAKEKELPFDRGPGTALFYARDCRLRKKSADDENDRSPKAAPVGSTSDLDRAWTLIGKKSSGPPARTEKIADRATTKDQDGQAQKTILIADDDGDLVQMIALRCSQIGIRVFRSPDAMHALLGVHRIRPDLVLLDVNMPGGNGLSICEMLAGDESLAKIPVIIMTGDSAEEIPRRCQAFTLSSWRKGRAFGNAWRQ